MTEFWLQKVAEQQLIFVQIFKKVFLYGFYNISVNCIIVLMQVNKDLKWNKIHICLVIPFEMTEFRLQKFTEQQ